MNCPDDTDVKRVSRLLLHQRIKNLWTAGVEPAGNTFVLAGHEASDIGCIRYCLGVPGPTAFFVEKSRPAPGLDIVRAQWSKANRFNGQLMNAIKTSQGEIKFINLDFCGYMTDPVVDVIRACRGRLAEGGVVAYTFTRDRENEVTTGWVRAKRLFARTQTTLKRGTTAWRDAVRFEGYREIIRRELKLGDDLVEIFKMQYTTSDNRNMGVLGLQYVPKSNRTAAWHRQMLHGKSEEEKLGRVDTTNLDERLLLITLDLTERFHPKHVAAMLHRSTFTLGAIEANKTRGAYAHLGYPARKKGRWA